MGVLNIDNLPGRRLGDVQHHLKMSASGFAYVDEAQATKAEAENLSIYQ